MRKITKTEAFNFEQVASEKYRKQGRAVMDKNENLRNIKLVAVDMDGTALNDSKELSPLTVETLTGLMERGIRLCVSTGRSWPGVRKYVEQLKPNAPVITNNGAMIIEPSSGTVVRSCVLVEQDARNIFKMAGDRSTSVLIWSNNVLYCNRIDERTTDYGHRYGGMDPAPLSQIEGCVSDEEAFETLFAKGITKILWYDNEKNANIWGRELQNHPFESVTVNTSEPCFIEFYNRQISKGKMLEYVCSQFDIGIEETVAAGDGENDISMLDIAGYAVVPKSASEHVKAHADEITESNNDDGIAQFLQRTLIND